MTVIPIPEALHEDEGIEMAITAALKRVLKKAK